MAFLLICSTFSLGQDSDQLERFQALERDIQHTYAEFQNSIVVIAVGEADQTQANAHQTFDEFFDVKSNRLPSRVGLGVIVEINPKDVLVLTQAHLVAPLVRQRQRSSPVVVTVRFSSRQTVFATVYAADPRSDLTVLKIDRSSLPNDLKAQPVSISEDPDVQAGQLVIAIGNPWVIARSKSASVGIGMVAGTERQFSPKSPESLIERQLHDLGTLLELDLAKTFSESGTALFKPNGSLVGMVNSLAQPPGAKVNSIYAIPMSRSFRRIVQELQQGYEAEYGFLGISLETSLPGTLAELGLASQQTTAPLVTRVAQSSPAEKGGMQQEDLILEVNGDKVTTSEELIREIGLLPPDEDVEVRVYRRNRGVRTLSIKLAKWPIYDDTLIVATNSRHPAWRGLDVDYATCRRRYLPDRFLTEFPRGVVVTSVADGSPAHLSGVKVGQFIQKVGDQEVETPAQFYQNVSGQSGDVRLRIGTESEVTIAEPAASAP